MRIIAGKWRSRHIDASEGLDTRPILDRAKQVLFDILGNRLAVPGQLPPIAVLDLFAGSGALGIEAISRGARYCLFIEQNRAITRIIRQNLDHLKVVDEAQVLSADAAHCSISAPPPAPDSPDEPPVYELVFIDPPYRLLTGPRPDPSITPLFGWLATEPLIAPNAVIVVRHAYQGTGGPDLSPLVEKECRDVGKMTLRFLTRPGGPCEEQP